ncbi:MAG: prolyl oligopeptidase family serine peptidase [Acidobacteria bacterium]|nr:prolyl oligopeptidase family serine peptidase [Acidobacteriota bacterium]
MNFRKRACLLFLILLLAAGVFGQAVSKVGMMSRAFVDEQRKNWSGTAARPLATTIWYPTDAAENEENVVIGNPADPVFICGPAVKNADISSKHKRYPLVVVSHGTGGSGLMMMWLGRYLAARGYIVAAVNHHGNTGAEEKYLAQGFVLWWERAQDLRVVIDRLLADPKIGPRIDAKKIGAAGFSLGGATVTAVAGGIFDLDAFDKFCASPEADATCGAQPEFPNALKDFEELRKKDAIVIDSLKRMNDSYRDPRVKAVFAIAPALGTAFTPESLKAIKIPFRLVVGEDDQTAPAKTNAQKLAAALKKSELTILPGKVAHYTFLADCTPLGQKVLPICRDDRSVDRETVHQTVGQLAFDFFGKNL